LRAVILAASLLAASCPINWPPQPVPSPTAVPTATPSPLPTASPTPTPTPDASCVDPGENVEAVVGAAATVAADVDAAVSAVRIERPHGFDGNYLAGWSADVAENHRIAHAFHGYVVAALGRVGLCAVHWGDAVGVKAGDVFEEYHLVNHGGGAVIEARFAYRHTFRPKFPPGPIACTNPTPGPIARMEVKVHVVGANFVTLDATPHVGRWDANELGERWCGRDWDYCRAVGFTDGRGYCSPRTEGHAERITCDVAITGGGIAWTWNGRPVTDDDGDVRLHPGGWMLMVRRHVYGTATACPKVRSGCGSDCGSVEISA
jgi:hypothetical protein